MGIRDTECIVARTNSEGMNFLLIPEASSQCDTENNNNNKTKRQHPLIIYQIPINTFLMLF